MKHFPTHDYSQTAVSVRRAAGGSDLTFLKVFFKSEGFGNQVLPMQRADNGDTALHIAAKNIEKTLDRGEYVPRSGDEEALKMILESQWCSPELLQIQNHSGETALHVAVKNDNLPHTQAILRSPHCTRELLELKNKLGKQADEIFSQGECRATILASQHGRFNLFEALYIAIDLKNVSAVREFILLYPMLDYKKLRDNHARWNRLQSILLEARNKEGSYGITWQMQQFPYQPKHLRDYGSPLHPADVILALHINPNFISGESMEEMNEVCWEPLLFAFFHTIMCDSGIAINLIDNDFPVPGWAASFKGGRLLNSYMRLMAKPILYQRLKGLIHHLIIQRFFFDDDDDDIDWNENYIFPNMKNIAKMNWIHLFSLDTILDVLSDEIVDEDLKWILAHVLYVVEPVEHDLCIMACQTVLNKAKNPQSILVQESADGYNAIHMSANHRSSNCLDALINSGYCSKQSMGIQSTDDGNTALHIAAANVIKTLKYRENLLRGGASKAAIEIILESPFCCPELLQKQNHSGDTALHIAVEANHLPHVKAILESAHCNRIMVERKNKKGKQAHEMVSSGECRAAILASQHRPRNHTQLMRDEVAFHASQLGNSISHVLQSNTTTQITPNDMDVELDNINVPAGSINYS